MAKLIPKEIPKKPSIAQVEKYLKMWDKESKYAAQEKALKKLFDSCPGNEKIEDVLLKVTAINDFYGTNIFNTYNVAVNIRDLHIDKRLQSGELDLVKEIARTKTEKGEIRNFYSFASKYCSNHQPTKYAIYDSYVDKMLRYFRQEEEFASFRNEDLKHYNSFFEIIKKFQFRFSLEKYDLKQIDQYLWLLGKECFPKYKKNKDAS